MKNLKKFVSIALILCSVLTLLSGCGNIFQQDDAEEPTALCVVIGARRNSPAADLSILYKAIYQVCHSHGFISAVVVDGEGQILFDLPVSPPQEQVDDQKLQQIANENANILIQNLSSAAARVPEADTLQSLSYARDILASKNTPKKELIIIDSFVSTAGILDFTSANLFDQSPETIVQQLQDRAAIPDMTDIDITIYGMGQTAGEEQARLTPQLRQKLEMIWRAILEAAGCRSIEISPAPLGSAEPQGPLPPVTCVPMISDSLTFASDTVSESVPDVVRLDEISFAFQGDSAQFTDPDKASEAVAPIAEALRAEPETSIYLAGMTASIGDDGLKLSRARAEAVKALLVKGEVREDQISGCLGLGSLPNCLRTPDLDSDCRI